MIIQKPTQNFAVGRKSYTPEIVVLHIMDGTLIGTDSWFASTQSGVSSHYGVGFTGEIHQYVKESDTAWANGQVVNPRSKFVKDRPINPNLYSISIECEGKDLSKAPEIQLQAIVGLIKTITNKYKIPCDREHIIGHYEIKSTKPNCPATDKSILDKIVARLNPTDELVPLLLPKSKLAKITSYLVNL